MAKKKSRVIIFEFSDLINTSPREAAYMLAKAAKTSPDVIHVTIEQMPDDWKGDFFNYAHQLGLTFTAK